MAKDDMRRPPRNIINIRPPPLPSAEEAGSECPKVPGRRFSPLHGLNQDPTPSGASSHTRPISNWMLFGDITLQPSGKSAMSEYGLGQSLGSIPGMVSIYHWDVLLLNYCAYPPAATRSFILPTRPLPKGCAYISCLK